MIKRSFFLLLATFAAGAFAQSDSEGVTTSTDPAKIAAIERHADELRARGAQASGAADATGRGAHAMKHHRQGHHRHHGAMKKSSRANAAKTTTTTQ